MKIDVSQSKSPHGAGNRLGRFFWTAAWVVLFRPSPKICHGWRRFLLRVFGAQIGRRVHVHPSVRIWAPWNLVMDDHSCLAPWVDCYCVARVEIGAHATVSQYSYLCAATHDHTRSDMPLVSAPIKIGNGAWVAADVFVGPGVTVGEGAVVGAKSLVVKDVPAWTVVGGNPAKVLGKREIRME